MFPPSQAPVPGHFWAPRVLPRRALPTCWGPGGCPADWQWGASEGCRAGLATDVARGKPAPWWPVCRSGWSEPCECWQVHTICRPALARLLSWHVFFRPHGPVHHLSPVMSHTGASGFHTTLPVCHTCAVKLAGTSLPTDQRDLSPIQEEIVSFQSEGSHPSGDVCGCHNWGAPGSEVVGQ